MNINELCQYTTIITGHQGIVAKNIVVKWIYGGNVIYFDTEDNSAELLVAGRSGFDKELTQIAAVTDEGTTFYNKGDVREFLTWLREQESTLAWAFNTQYDLGNVCHEGKAVKLDDFDVLMVKGRFISGKWKGISFYDVQNLSGQGSSVGKLGMAVNLPKFGYDYKKEDFNKFFTQDRRKEYLKFKKMSKAELFRNREYVFRDCEILRAWINLVKKFTDHWGLERVPGTLGGLCVKAFEAQGFENWFEASDESASALYGGRVEIFSPGGTGNIYYCDINSLYPFSMTRDFPVSFTHLKELDGYGVCRCIVTAPKKIRIGVLPWHDENGSMIFPVGRFAGTWTIAELKMAIENGYKIEKVEWIYGSKQAKPYYAQYIRQCYDNRLAAPSTGEKQFWKLLMNNLYGRLAISGVVSRSLNLTKENCGDVDGVPYGRKILRDYEMPLPTFSNYLHAAHVLSYSRLHLLWHLQQIEPDNLIYCDTDSIFFFHDPKKPLPFSIGKELGQMKIESQEQEAYVWLPKTYQIGNDWKAKGVRREKAKEFILQGRTEFDLPFRLREAIRCYNDGNSRKLAVWRRVEKIMQSIYDKKRKSGNFYLPKVVNDVTFR